jgi:hypothetical protein
MLFAMVKIVTPGLDPGVHLQKKMMDGRDRRAEATPSFGRLCPAMTIESSS